MLFEARPTDAQVLGNMMELLERGEATMPEVDRWLDARFGTTAAVMILDMCGFTRSTREKGILEFLRRMYEVQKVIIPIIDREAGMVLNTLADSLCALFPDVDSALFAATDMIEALDKHNVDYPDAPNHYVSIGIGFGRILVIGGSDAFGDEMNHAGKLGEDIAGEREILLTPKAVQELGDDIPLNAATYEIAGKRVVCGVVDLDTWDAEALRQARGH